MKITRDDLHNKTNGQLCALFKKATAALANHPRGSAARRAVLAAAELIRQEQARRGPAP